MLPLQCQNLLMTKKDEVKLFLNELHQKMKIWGIIFVGRDKNTQTLADLEITPLHRESVLRDLKIDDYCEGPIPNTQFGTKDMWVFGKMVKQKEIYIKIALNSEGLKSICISFHIAEFPLQYPLK